ncbi:sodium-dependent glucose transporter 1-like isoform X2 [Tigriopus californicus]|uniref:sodium-dependent glucose transporter 1-like isoform X2 n=1 Tax=Tigriopus californicus TaxID=6832 RepID=UPI0027D9E3E7|nr:sodium-dependent glucose transporter 1-like isoform X2 [Tigriopus californicus]
MESGTKWILCFAVVSNIAMIFANALMTVLGPSQPFLAQQLDVEIDTISSMWTISFMSAIIGSLMASFTFKPYIINPLWKMVIFGCGSALSGLCTICVPYSPSFGHLSILLVLNNIISGYWMTGNGGMFVYTLGPKKSRSLVMLHHFTVSLGFLLGPMLMGHYFTDSLPSNDTICSSNMTLAIEAPPKVSLNLNQVPHEPPHHVPSRLSHQPFWILGILQVASSLLYFGMTFVPYQMPVQEELKVVQQAKNLKEAFTEDLRSLIPLMLFFALSCGSERIFQSMQFSFGLCGPLQLSPPEAVITDKSYNGGFMLGRFIGMFVAHVGSPKLMLKISLAICFPASLFTSIFAAKSQLLFVSCAGVYGFAISWQFGAAYSWAAKYLDVVSHLRVATSQGTDETCYLAPRLVGQRLLIVWT